MAYVVLDRVQDVLHPDYCLHGWTWCVVCSHKVHLGHTTHDIVLNGRAKPLCLRCANQYVPQDSPREQLHDHKRADGPHGP